MLHYKDRRQREDEVNLIFRNGAATRIASIVRGFLVRRHLHRGGVKAAREYMRIEVTQLAYLAGRGQDNC